MTDSSIIKPFFFIKIKIVNKKNSKQWILFNYPKTREFGLVSCEGLMSLRDRIVYYYFVHTIDLSVANNVICPITLKYSLENTFIPQKIIKNKELIKT